jgi:hypothetical protein
MPCRRNEIIDLFERPLTGEGSIDWEGIMVKSSWAVLLCKFKDDPSESPVPNFRTVCDRFFTPSGVGTFNAVRFFSDMSHGSLDLSGSQVFGWFTLDVNFNDRKSQEEMVTLAKQAARGAGVPLDTFFGFVLIMNTPTGAAQGQANWPGGAPGPGAFMDCRRVNGFPGLPRVHEGNGTESFGQEMGHGYGLKHSRSDNPNIDLLGCGSPGPDYRDAWDIMSTACAFSALDPDYTARGPGLNAWNMRGVGWLDETRVWRGPSGTFTEVVQLRPLHRRDLPGPLAVELPPVGGHSAYLIEFRIKEGWDAGIPRSAVLVHRFQDKISYLMSGANGNQDLVAGDLFGPGTGAGPFPRVEVLKIDENSGTATVRLSYTPKIPPRTHFIVSENADGRLELLALGEDGAVYHKGQTAPNAGWGEWSSLSGTALRQIVVDLQLNFHPATVRASAVDAPCGAV